MLVEYFMNKYYARFHIVATIGRETDCSILLDV